MVIRSTRLRYIKGSTLQDVCAAVDGLPFKVEIKNITQDSQGAWLCLFVIPDELPEFQNVELGE